MFSAALLARYTSQLPSVAVETSVRLPMRDVMIASVPCGFRRSKKVSAKHIGL